MVQFGSDSLLLPQVIHLPDEQRQRSTAEVWGRRVTWTVLLSAIVLGAFYSLTDLPASAVTLNAQKQTIAWANAFGTHGCATDPMVTPSSEDDIISAVQQAARLRQRVKVVGAGLSWTPLVCSQDRAVQLISLQHYNRILSVDTARSQVSVQAGITIGDLNKQLRAYGFALAATGSMPSSSLAGALATATHGHSTRNGSLSSLLDSLSFVDGKGRVVIASAAENRYVVSRYVVSHALSERCEARAVTDLAVLVGSSAETCSMPLPLALV